MEDKLGARSSEFERHRAFFSKRCWHSLNRATRLLSLLLARWLLSSSNVLSRTYAGPVVSKEASQCDIDRTFWIGEGRRDEQLVERRFWDEGKKCQSISG